MAPQPGLRHRRGDHARAFGKARRSRSDGSDQCAPAAVRGLPLLRRPLERLEPRTWLARFSLLPSITDTYVLSGFLFYFVNTAGQLRADVPGLHVLRTAERHHPQPDRHGSRTRVPLLPHAAADLRTDAVRRTCAVLVTFGVLTKHNEVTAFKACGVSLYRLAAPILVAGVVLSGGLFAFDHY